MANLDTAVASKIMSYWPVNEHRTRNQNALGMVNNENGDQFAVFQI
jgi:hypothetical protein